MPDTCTHLHLTQAVTPSSAGCEDCLPIGGQWVHLRMCMTCGHVGCCDSSPNRHATGHWVEHRDHPIIRSYEPGEDWWWCYEDDLAFEIDGAGPGDAARLTTAGPVLMRAGPDGVEVLIWATT